MGKANFDDIYTADDPRAYFQTLGALDYQIPAHAASVFSTIAAQVARARDIDTVTITDVCCSYGINAAVMKYDATYEEIVDHYTAEECLEFDRQELLARDDSFFTQDDLRPGHDGPSVDVIGLDVSEEAINYAIDAGFLDGGASEDLEAHDPTPDLARMLATTDLVTVTGGIGYVTDRTMGRVLDATPTPPWMAALCLRWVDFSAIAEAGEARGMVVHRLEDVTFPQRRFLDTDEQDYVLDELARLEIDADGREADGYHHAELFVMHPATEPLDGSLADVLDPGR